MLSGPSTLRISSGGGSPISSSSETLSSSGEEKQDIRPQYEHSREEVRKEGSTAGFGVRPWDSKSVDGWYVKKCKNKCCYLY